jgi:membrane-associated protein
MEFLSGILDVFLHIDRHLLELVANYGVWVYGILFLVVFLETGLVIAPFLPGDSLLFASGALAATSALDLASLLLVLTIAAVLGDTLNYTIGRMIGPKVFSVNHRLFNQKHLIRTQEFYERHGGKTIVLARFLPIVRTFAPFVAGVGRMNYFRFWVYNAVGGFLWVASFTFLGYFFGTRPLVKDHFGLVIVAIVLISTIPVAVEVWRSWVRKKRSQA